MGLFDKKNCDICGGKIGMMGNRKLDDGNLCKDCANRLSPFFSDRRRSTVADIREQLAYREANRAAVTVFSTTRTLGTGTKVLLDENAGKFMVTAARKLEDENPDVLDFSQVTGCNVDVNESKKELKQRDHEGKEVSYNPPRYVYEYDFYFTIHVNTPYFDEIKFKLNNNTIKVEPPVSGGSFATGSSFTPRSSVSTGGKAAPISKSSPGGKSGPGGQPDVVSQLGAVIGQIASAGQPAAQGVDLARQNIDYRECEALGEEIREALTKVRQDVRESAVAAQAPKQAVTCPSCGASTIPDVQGRCEYCRGAISI